MRSTSALAELSAHCCMRAISFMVAPDDVAIAARNCSSAPTWCQVTAPNSPLNSSGTLAIRRRLRPPI